MLFIEDYRDAYKYVKLNKNLVSIYAVQVFVIILLSTIPIIIIPFITTHFNATAKDFAIFEGLFASGVIFGSIISPTLCKKFTVFWVLFSQGILLTFALLFFSQIDNILLAETIHFFIGFGMSAWAIILTQAQSFTENNMQGKMQGICFSISGIFILIIYLLINLYEKAITINIIYIIESIFGILMTLFIVFSFKLLKNQQ